MKVELNKKYRYRNGEPARVLCVDAPGSEPVVSIDKDGAVNRHQSDGSYYEDRSSSSWDLTEVRELREWEICGNPAGAGCIVVNGPNLKCEDTIRVREVIE